jgi:hypothetical protein
MFRKIKNRKVLLALFTSAILFQSNLNLTQKKGLVQFQIILNDGDRIDLHNFIQSDEVGQKLGVLPDLFQSQESFDTFQKSAIVRSLAPQGMQPSTLVEYIKWNSEVIYLGYFQPDPITLADARYSDFIFFNSEYHWDLLENFNSYYLSVFNSETARKIAFEGALEFVIKMVENYPSDFKRSILEQIDGLILFTNYLKNNPYLLQEEDPKYVSESSSYFKGFIFRRIRTSHVPISEVLTDLNIAKAKIQAAIPKDGFALIDISINEDIKMFWGAEAKCYLYSNLNQKVEELIAFPNFITMYSENGKNFYLVEFDNGTKNLFSQDLHKEY